MAEAIIGDPSDEQGAEMEAVEETEDPRDDFIRKVLDALEIAEGDNVFDVIEGLQALKTQWHKTSFLAETWAQLPPCAQRLALCESARAQQNPLYFRGARVETWKGQTWQVETEGDVIRLTGKIDEDKKQEGLFNANRLRSEVAGLIQRLKQGEPQLERDEEKMKHPANAADPGRVERLERMRAEIEGLQVALVKAQAELSKAEEDAGIETDVVLEFPVLLMEDPEWA